ncbi:MAG TPA: LysR family transcriptional regulator [Candidatus Ventrimonas merdavium]|nr:LysR family transcriptional regulator [Candidatus Ventrimonas merdavium]
MEQDMKYIYTIYKKQSISKAAEALYMTQPALSIAVSRVEDSLGTRLFNRDQKPLELTEAGELYINKVLQIQALEDELQAQLNDLSGLKTGILKIGGSHYLNSYILPPILTAFSRQHPGIQLELVEAGSYELLDMLKEHVIDITFNCTLSPKDSWNRIPGFQDMILLAVPSYFEINDTLQTYRLTGQDILSKRHLRPDCPSVTMDLFPGIPFILLTPGNNLYSRCRHFFECAKTEPAVCLQVSQLVTAYHLARGGMAATFISDWLIKDECPDLFLYKIDSPQATRSFDLVTRGKTYMPKAQQEFIRIFKDYYE